MTLHGYDVEQIWRAIEDVIIKTLISAHPVIKHNYHTCFPSHTLISACFEILGFDILLDRKLKPWLLEVRKLGVSQLLGDISFGDSASLAHLYCFRQLPRPLLSMVLAAPGAVTLSLRSGHQRGVDGWELENSLRLLEVQPDLQLAPVSGTE